MSQPACAACPALGMGHLGPCSGLAGPTYDAAVRFPDDVARRAGREVPDLAGSTGAAGGVDR